MTLSSCQLACPSSLSSFLGSPAFPFKSERNLMIPCADMALFTFPLTCLWTSMFTPECCEPTRGCISCPPPPSLQWPGGPLKDKENGYGKHDKITAGWLDGAVNLGGVIKVPLWLTLSLTSLRHEEDGSGWLPSPSWNDGMDEVDFLNYLLFISFYQQKSRKIIPRYITALLFLTIFVSNSAEKWSGPCWTCWILFFPPATSMSCY